jgi:signal transduction histidine kinase
MHLPDPPAAAESFRTWRQDFWRRVIATSDPARKRQYRALTCALVVVIGIADYYTGFELSLLVFYLVPVCMAVAAVGWKFGTVISVASVATWLAGDVLAGARFANPLVPGWNALIALGTYLIVVWLVASVIALQREMEARVRQRTVALTEEIAERLRLEKAVLEITERERRTIGHDLHDGLSQHLTGTALVAQALRSRLQPRAEGDAADVGKIVTLIEEAIEQTRSLAKGLLLAEVEQDGLVSALHELAAKTRDQFRVECAFTCAADVRLGGGGAATHLYRIAEEAARNGIRHGRARRVALALDAEGDNLVLSVRDDGAGLPPPAARGQGLGLRIMAHRAAMIGASFEVAAQPGGGTLVVCRLRNRTPTP